MNAYDELVARIKQIPISRLGDVVAAMEGKLESRGFTKRQLEEAGAMAAAPTTHEELVDIERRMLAEALRRRGGNQSAAARDVGYERKAFARRCKKLKVA